MTTPTRITLIDRIRETLGGDSWFEFTNVYERLILDWLKHQGVQSADADDLRQEVMSVVAKEIASFEHNGRAGAFRKWLRQITSHQLHRHWRNRNSDKLSGSVDLSELADQLADDRSRVSAIWDAEHNRYMVNYLLGTLANRFDEKSIRAFRKIVLKQEPAAQVAHELGTSLGAARVAQHRVLKALKEIGHCLID